MENMNSDKVKHEIICSECGKKLKDMAMGCVFCGSENVKINMAEDGSDCIDLGKPMSRRKIFMFGGIALIILVAFIIVGINGLIGDGSINSGTGNDISKFDSIDGSSDIMDDQVPLGSFEGMDYTRFEIFFYDENDVIVDVISGKIE